MYTCQSRREWQFSDLHLSRRSVWHGRLRGIYTQLESDEKIVTRNLVVSKIARLSGIQTRWLSYSQRLACMSVSSATVPCHDTMFLSRCGIPMVGLASGSLELGRARYMLGLKDKQL